MTTTLAAPIYTPPTVTPLPRPSSSVLLPGGVELLLPRRCGR